jgi:hypothetical protein
VSVTKITEGVSRYCRISLRGYEAARLIGSAGYSNVEVMEGGIMAWPSPREKYQTRRHLSDMRRRISTLASSRARPGHGPGRIDVVSTGILGA